MDRPGYISDVHVSIGVGWDKPRKACLHRQHKPSRCTQHMPTAVGQRVRKRRAQPSHAARETIYTINEEAGSPIRLAARVKFDQAFGQAPPEQQSFASLA
jgi:hypothetical protein